MHVPNTLVEKQLRKTGKFNDEQINGLLSQADSEKKPLQDIVIQTNTLSETDLTRFYADEIDVPFADINPSDLNKEILQLIPEQVARQYKAAAFDQDEDGVVYIVMEDPDDIQAINFIQKHLGKPIRIHIGTASAIQAAIDQYSSSNVSSELAKVIAVENKEIADEQVAEEDVAEDSPIAQTVNLIIDFGIKSRASDIHIEPRDNLVIVRYRVDGVLHIANKLPRKVLGALVSRIKILANLKIDEHRAPQDGRFKIAVNNHVYALRVSTLPVVDGEKVALRILDESSEAATLEDLGFWGESLYRVNESIVQPNGLILVTGPTGSGKSTTLFSILSHLNNPSVNISTIEDPVEYHILGVNQTQVNPVAGMTFATGLRSLLRQDPNIIMVGEIRDGETADLAVQAALTGHLVFSTLHTNNASTTLPRLLDMEVEPFLIASTIRIVIGQRLVRRLCPYCREDYVPDNAVIQRIISAFNIKNANYTKIINLLEKQAIESGIGLSKQKSTETKSADNPSTTPQAIKRLWKKHDEGCVKCNHSGYLGRLGIYEVLKNDKNIQNLIVTKGTSENMESQSISTGMITMQIDGLIKVLRGLTTIEEIMRVTSTDR